MTSTSALMESATGSSWNGRDELRANNSLSLVNHKRDWAPVINRGNIDVYEVGLIARPATAMSLNFLFISIYPVYHVTGTVVLHSGTPHCDEDFVNVFGCWKVGRSLWAKREHLIPRPEVQNTGAGVLNNDRIIDGEGFKVLKGADSIEHTVSDCEQSNKNSAGTHSEELLDIVLAGKLVVVVRNG